ncbi:MAG: hypothetical protein HRT97_00740 [Moritella sp.]|uniref:DUF6942 family protein n=1 Tax=Moritella sp. TaxID=78556 RepID=UPI0025DA91FF|nr:hypothetical protein [Moritella sp.]NQZ90850.1 hypothetical protein [Moritella sp.]
MTNRGLGCSKFTFAVYLANTPNMLEYQGITGVNSLVSGEINAIGQACGNGWRKVFNVYAKLLYALNPADFSFAQRAPTWQQYRDGYLLQAGSATALLFSPPELDANTQTIHIICGRTYAKQLLASGELQANLIWLDDEFAIDKTNRLIVCPYFDYRQLSNIKIERLSVMLSQLVNGVEHNNE